METQHSEVYGLTIHPTDADWDILQRVLRLCPPQDVALRVVKLARDPDVDITQLARCIELDPTLTALALQTVNSAHFGLSCRINSVSQAVSLLGIKSLRLMATAFVVMNPLSTGLPRGLYQSFWKRSLTTAITARECAPASDTDDRHVSFTTGLLSDVGVLAFAQVQGTAYHEMYSELYAEPLQLIEEERRRFDTDHIRIGGLLLAKFSLDSNIVHAILSMGEPADDATTQELCPLSRRVFLAHCLSDVLSNQNQYRWEWVRERFLEEFGIDTDGLLDLILRIRTDLDEWGRVFKLEFPAVSDAEFRTIASEALAAMSIEGAVEPSIFDSYFGSTQP